LVLIYALLSTEAQQAVEIHAAMIMEEKQIKRERNVSEENSRFTKGKKSNQSGIAMMVMRQGECKLEETV
jgi:hypothetical protein